MHEWRSASLSELADIRVSNVDKKAAVGEKAIRLCNYMDVYSNDYIRQDLPFMEASASAAEVAKFKVMRGDVLITKDSETPDDIGIPAVVVDEVEDLVCGYHVALLRPKQHLVDPIFLSKQLAMPQTASFFASRAAGSTRYGLSNGAIAKAPILCAPLGQQQKIAAILTSLDTAIEKTKALIEKHQQIKAGLMNDLFTRGVLPNGQLRPLRQDAPELYQKTPLGWLPIAWEPSSCGQVCSIDTGITLGPHRRPGRRAHPYLRVANVHRDEIRLDDVAMLEALPGETDLALKQFDLLVVEGHANTAQIGRCAMVEGSAEGMLFQNHLFRLRPARIDVHFVLQWMNSHHVQRYWERTCATSSGLNTINRSILNAAPIYVPTEGEQLWIVNAVAAARKRIQAELGNLSKLRTQKLGLMQDLLTGKVPVNVDVPAVEPAHA